MSERAKNVIAFTLAGMIVLAITVTAEIAVIHWQRPAPAVQQACVTTTAAR